MSVFVCVFVCVCVCVCVWEREREVVCICMDAFINLNSYVFHLCYWLCTAPRQARKTRAELMKDIDADYYGYRDEDDGLIVPAEQEAERIGKEKQGGKA